MPAPSSGNNAAPWYPGDTTPGSGLYGQPVPGGPAEDPNGNWGQQTLYNYQAGGFFGPVDAALGIGSFGKGSAANQLAGAGVVSSAPDQTLANQSGAQQNAYLQQLMQQMRGTGGTPGQAQLANSIQQAAAAQQGSAQSNRYGLAPGQAAYQGASQAAGIQSAGENQAQQQQALSMQNASGQYGQTSAQLAQQNMAQAAGAAQLQQANAALGAGLYSGEQQQTQAFNQGILGSSGNAAGAGIGSLIAAAAKGGVVGGPPSHMDSGGLNLAAPSGVLNAAAPNAPQVGITSPAGSGLGSAAQQLAIQGVNPVTLDTSQTAAARAGQEAYLQQLQGQMASGAPSVAQAQLSSGLQNAIAANAAAAHPTAYGQSPSLAAGLAGNAATGNMNQVINHSAAQQLAAQHGLQALYGSGLGAVHGQDIAQAQTAAQLAQDHNTLVAGLYGQEQGQQNAMATALFSSGTNAAGGGLQSLSNSLGNNSGITGPSGVPLSAADSASMNNINSQPVTSDYSDIEAAPGKGVAAKGGVVGHKTYLGEKAPEAVLPADGKGEAKVVTKPTLADMSGKQKVVLPLVPGTAPYHPGPLPTQAGPGPSQALPPGAKIDPQALMALAGRGVAPSQPGVAPLSPQTAPTVAKAMQSLPGGPQGGPEKSAAKPKAPKSKVTPEAQAQIRMLTSLVVRLKHENMMLGGR